MPQPFANTQELVAVEDVRDDAIIMKNGGLRQVLIVGGVNFALKSESEQNTITQLYQSFLNALDFPVQVLIHSRKINIEKYLGTLEERKEKESSGLLQDQIAEYVDFIREFVRKNAIMEKTFLVTVPFSPVFGPTKESVMSFLPFLKTKKASKNPPAGGGPTTDEEKEARLKEGLAQLKQRTSEVAQNLSSIGLEVVTLNTEQLVELLYNFYNPESMEREYAGK